MAAEIIPISMAEAMVRAVACPGSSYPKVERV